MAPLDMGLKSSFAAAYDSARRLPKHPFRLIVCAAEWDCRGQIGHSWDWYWDGTKPARPALHCWHCGASRSMCAYFDAAPTVAAFGLPRCTACDRQFLVRDTDPYRDGKCPLCAGGIHP